MRAGRPEQHLCRGSYTLALWAVEQCRTKGHTSGDDCRSGSSVVQLTASHLDQWRQGRVKSLERVVQANLSKVTVAMAGSRRTAAG
jgi:hypothetical protein